MILDLKSFINTKKVIKIFIHLSQLDRLAHPLKLIKPVQSGYIVFFESNYTI
jgi:hypothetical protein